MNHYLQNMFSAAVKQLLQNIDACLEKDNKAQIIDIGCGDGLIADHIGSTITSRNIVGIDVIESELQKAKKHHIQVYKHDANRRLPFKQNTFDVVHANQIIEHINNSDLFMDEIYRILKPGGYAVLSTENASSWVNIFASVFGWQIFSLTNFSAKKRSIGNPFALHRNDTKWFSSWNHVRIYNYFGLLEYMTCFGFSIEAVKGAGYFPLPPQCGLIDPIHAHFITLKIRKI